MWHHKYGPQSLEGKAKLAREQAESLRRQVDEKMRELNDVGARYEAADKKASALEELLVPKWTVPDGKHSVEFVAHGRDGVPSTGITVEVTPGEVYEVTIGGGEDESHAESNEPPKVLPTETPDRAGEEPSGGVEGEAGGGAGDAPAVDVPVPRPPRGRRLPNA